MNIMDIVHSLMALVVCGAAFMWGVAEWPAGDRRVAMYCWYAHAVGAFAIVAVYLFYYAGGDLIVYHRVGGLLSRYVEYDVPRNFPKIVLLLLQQPHEIPVQIFGSGSSTGSMVAVAALTGLLTQSLWAASIVVGTLSAAGQACLWAGLGRLVPVHRRAIALRCTMLVPSVIFWTSSFMKEAFALIGIGVIVLGAGRLKLHRTFSGLLLIVLGAGILGLFKAYILFPLSVAAGTYFYWSRAATRGGVRIRPMAFLMGAAAIVGLTVLLGGLFPRYAVETLSESIEQQQLASLSTAGGSDFRSEEGGERGTTGLLLDAPFTVMTALLRPFVFESRSAMMLVNSVETTAVLYFMVMAFVRTGRVELARWVWRSPDIMASVVFVLLFSLAVGLATTNLGTLSRYRLPMMPFYFYVVFSAYALPATRAAQQKALAMAAVPPSPLAPG
jgi:hypothetical protein